VCVGPLVCAASKLAAPCKLKLVSAHSLCWGMLYSCAQPVQQHAELSFAWLAPRLTRCAVLCRAVPRCAVLSRAVPCCAVLCRWVFLGEGLPSITFALLLPCLLPGGPSRMGSSSLLNHKELQMLRTDVSEAPSRGVQAPA
jgi:hypothetical protein